MTGTETKLTYLDAIMQALTEEMHRDERVMLMGQDIAAYGGGSMLQSFSERRIKSTPISENATAGMGVGAAITGLRPVIDITMASFIYLASDQLINQASKLRYMTGGQLKIPLVVRACMYYRMGVAAQHADRPYTAFMNVPGLKILVPSTPADVKGLLKAAIRDDDPVLVFEDASLWAKKDMVSTDPDYLVPIGSAAVRREGTDVTVIGIGGAVHTALAAAKMLEKDGISTEVIDPRTLVPLDTETIIKSVEKTGRLVVVDNAHRTGSAASEIAAVITEEAFESLKKPVRRVTTPDVHLPYAISLEKQLIPDKDKVASAVRDLMA